MINRSATFPLITAALLGCWQSTPLVAQTTTTVRVASGLSKPVFVTAPATDPSRLYIVEQGNAAGSAQIKILNLATNTLSPTPFLTITGLATSGSEQGLLGMAFDPGFATNGKFYVNVTAPGGTFNQGITQIRQYTASTADTAGTAFNTVFSLSQPQDNHNGGWIGFSPRAGDANNLYIAMGDGGAGNDSGTGHDPGGNAQSTTNLLGKILRIQINSTTGTYTNPSTNPFNNEVFTLGLRNPFRSSFDRLTGDLFIGDVGQSAREEVNRQLASKPNGGENYGWRLREGTIQTPASGIGGPQPAGNVEPILDYDRTVGQTITGGYVYRGSASSLYGKYLFGDFVAGKLFTTNPDGSGGRQDVTALLDPVGTQSIRNPSSFGEDAQGEVYIVDYSDGEVYRVVPEPGTASILCVAALLTAGYRRSRRTYRPAALE